MPQLWAGIDAGKGHHHCVVMDGDGTRLLSRKVNSDEQQTLALLAEVVELAAGEAVVWATDLNGGGAGSLIAVLVAHRQRLLYISGRTGHQRPDGAVRESSGYLRGYCGPLAAPRSARRSPCDVGFAWRGWDKG